MPGGYPNPCCCVECCEIPPCQHCEGDVFIPCYLKVTLYDLAEDECDCSPLNADYILCDCTSEVCYVDLLGFLHCDNIGRSEYVFPDAVCEFNRLSFWRDYYEDPLGVCTASYLWLKLWQSPGAAYIAWRLDVKDGLPSCADMLDPGITIPFYHSEQVQCDPDVSYAVVKLVK